ncbi:hypothetical protein J6590_070932 [Homalodisca vitripennis]|nr:hypothetical protein J6590_070932 [Homalodisca vitripennis]
MKNDPSPRTLKMHSCGDHSVVACTECHHGSKIKWFLVVSVGKFNSPMYSRRYGTVFWRGGGLAEGGGAAAYKQRVGEWLLSLGWAAALI